MAEPISIRTLELPDVILLHVCGEVDMATAPMLRQVLISAVATRRHVVVSIHDVEYIDMAGFHALEAGKAAKAAGQNIAVVGSSAHVKRVLRVIQFNTVLPTFESEPEALEFVRT